MKSISTYFLKDRRCGNCRFSSRFEIILYPEEMLKLRDAAKEILAGKQDGPIKSENIIDILTCIEGLKKKKCFCKRENIWTHFLDPACSIWESQKNPFNKKTVIT